MKFTSRGALVRIPIYCIIAIVAVAFFLGHIFHMPGRSYRGPLPELTPEQSVLSAELRRAVEILAVEIGERNVGTLSNLNATADFIEQSLAATDMPVARQQYEIGMNPVYNIEATLTGAERPDEIVIVGAHYDTVYQCPGANDNGTGVAALLALARRLGSTPLARTVRFVAFVNEEPPFFRTASMGSVIYANRCRERNENIILMLSLETIGYYTDEPNTQTYPVPGVGLVYPNTGNFIGFGSNIKSADMLRKVVGLFREHAKFPSEGGAIDIGWSDQWSFWKAGYPGVMITDTAPYRYPWYHDSDDTPDKLDFDRMARVVEGLAWVVRGVAALPRSDQ
jgi:hypothetical protein